MIKKTSMMNMIKTLIVLVITGFIWSLPSRGVCTPKESSVSQQSKPKKGVKGDPDLTYDVVVYGGTSGGVISAYTARKYGQRVLIVEPGRHLGGMSSSGLGYTDVGDERTVTGLTREFYRRIGHIYGKASRDSIAAVLTSLDFNNGSNYGGGAGEGWTFEPHIAEQVFQSFVDEADIEVLYSRQVTKLKKKGTKIKQITLAYAGEGAGGGDLTVAADVFIDASYTGDLMARSGASYIVGRESNKMYGEEHNGVEYDPASPHQFTGGMPGGSTADGGAGAGPPVDPYVVKGDSSSGLLPGITGVGHAPNGTGDHKVQAYNFRLCLCKGKQRMPFSKPEDYNSDRYELLLRDMKADPPRSLRDLFITSPMPNGKSDFNNYGAYSTDYVGGSWKYPEASYAERDSIWAEHKHYEQGLMWFVGHDPRVPDAIRSEMRLWGLCRDEFLDTDGWPHQLYVREARRLQGEYVLTEKDAYGERIAPGAIAFGSYPMDSHTVQRIVVKDKSSKPMVKNEGIVYVLKGDWPYPGDKPYPIPYKIITPKRKEVTNLLVTFGVSASHIANGSYRQEPPFMVVSQAAGVAASWAAQKDIPVQKVNVAALQHELHDNPLAGLPLPQKHPEQYRFHPNLGYAGDR